MEQARCIYESRWSKWSWKVVDFLHLFQMKYLTNENFRKWPNARKKSLYLMHWWSGSRNPHLTFHSLLCTYAWCGACLCNQSDGGFALSALTVWERFVRWIFPLGRLPSLFSLPLANNGHHQVYKSGTPLGARFLFLGNISHRGNHLNFFLDSRDFTPPEMYPEA